MKPEEVREIVQDAVKETLVSIGINPKDTTEVQQDMAYIRQFRLGTQSLKGNIGKTIITVLIPGLLYVVWSAIKVLLK